MEITIIRSNKKVAGPVGSAITYIGQQKFDSCSLVEIGKKDAVTDISRKTKRLSAQNDTEEHNLASSIVKNKNSICSKWLKGA